MNSDMFLSLLALDSYNRGYGAKVTISSASHIGIAEILPDSEQRPQITGGQAAGFYAIPYTVSGVVGIADGTTVISYRGTNFDFEGGLSSPGPCGLMQ